MNGCESDGDLRAYVDRELPPREAERLASHLAVCGECDARYRQIEARATRVAAALSGLAVSAGGARIKPAAPKARMWPRWAVAAGVAAALAFALVSPKIERPAADVARQKAQFIALDNEPID